jgi:hypothetical protein
MSLLKSAGRWKTVRLVTIRLLKASGGAARNRKRFQRANLLWRLLKLQTDPENWARPVSKRTLLETLLTRRMLSDRCCKRASKT